MTAFFVIVGSILTLYTQMLRIQYETQARQSLIQDSYFVVERINTLMSDYSIIIDPKWAVRRQGHQDETWASRDIVACLPITVTKIASRSMTQTKIYSITVPLRPLNKTKPVSQGSAPTPLFSDSDRAVTIKVVTGKPPITPHGRVMASTRCSSVMSARTWIPTLISSVTQMTRTSAWAPMRSITLASRSSISSRLTIPRGHS